MPEINQFPVNIPSSNQQGQIPIAVRQKLLADQLAEQEGASTTPIYHPAAGMARLAAALGGSLMEKGETDKITAQQQAAAAAGQIPLNPVGGGAPGATPASAAPGAGGADTNTVVSMVKAAAAKYGVDPNTAAKVLGVESSNGAAYYGDKGPDGKPSSFGPLQLHYGNINPNMPHSGMGDDFTKATGLDARDPSTVPQQIDFAMSQVPKTGWAPWATTRDKLGITNWTGVNGSQVAQAGGSAPPAAAAAAPPSAAPNPNLPVKTASNSDFTGAPTPGAGGFMIPGAPPTPPASPYGNLVVPKSPYGDLSGSAPSLSPAEMQTLKQAMGPGSNNAAPSAGPIPNASPNDAASAGPIPSDNSPPPPAVMAAQFAPVSNAISAATDGPISLPPSAGGSGAALGPGDSGAPAPSAPTPPSDLAAALAAARSVPVPNAPSGPQGPLPGDFGAMGGGSPPAAAPAAPQGPQGPLAGDFGQMADGGQVTPEMLAAASRGLINVPPQQDPGPMSLDSGLGGAGAPVGPGDGPPPTDLASALAAARRVPIPADNAAPPPQGMPAPQQVAAAATDTSPPLPPDVSPSAVAGLLSSAPPPSGASPAALAAGLGPQGMPAPPMIPPQPPGNPISSDQPQGNVAPNIPTPPPRPANLGASPVANLPAPGATNAGPAPAVIPAPAPPPGSPSPQAIAAALGGPTMSGRNNTSAQTPTQFNVAQATGNLPSPAPSNGKAGLLARILGGGAQPAAPSAPPPPDTTGPTSGLTRLNNMGPQPPQTAPSGGAPAPNAPASGGYNPNANVPNSVIQQYNDLVKNPYATKEQLDMAQARIAQYQPRVLPDGRTVTIGPNGPVVSPLPVAHEWVPGRDGQPGGWKDTGPDANAPSAATFAADKAFNTKQGEEAAAREGDMQSAAAAAPGNIARLQLLQTVLAKTSTGALAPELGTAVSFANRLGISPDTLKGLGIDPNQAVNNEVANKLASELTVGSIGAKNGGFPASNFSVAEREFLQKMFPTIENQPGSNSAVSDVLVAKEQRAMQKANEYQTFKDNAKASGKPARYEDFENQFATAHANDNVFQPVIDKYNAGSYTTQAAGGGGPPAGGPSGNAPPQAPQNNPPAPQQAPPVSTVKTPADVAKLPSGTRFIIPDGSGRIGTAP